MTVNVEKVFIDFLNDRHALVELRVEAFADVPKDRPDAFITVERVGGGFDSVVLDRASVAVQAWSESRHKASELAYLVDELLLDKVAGLVSCDCVTKVTRETLYNFPDETGNVSRYQAVYNCVIVNN
jgi:hypothetical protein